MAATGNRTRITICFLVATAIGAGFFYFINPAACPPCPLHALTGLNCPGCGATRAGHELLHGHFLAAVHLNAPLVLALPILLAVGLWPVLTGDTRDPVKTLAAHHQWGWLILLLVLTFGIVRNIPSYPFTLLAP